jgi:hypothetical protein
MNRLERLKKQQKMRKKIRVKSNIIESITNDSTLENFQLKASSDEIESLLSSLNQEFDKKRFDELFTKTKEDLKQSIIVPFGLGKVISAYDKAGGNVDTIYNVRQDIYATDEARKEYKNQEEYNSKSVHSDRRYIKHNKETTLQQKEGTLIDEYTHQKIGIQDNKNLDHIVSAKETHDDKGRVLAGISTEDLANIDKNFNPTLDSINKSKGAKSPEEFANYLDNNRKERQNRITLLENDINITDKDTKELKKLKSLESVDTNQVRKAGIEAQMEQNKYINKEYYLSNKFLKNTVNTSAKEGLKMGTQQAFGILLIELFTSSFKEIKLAMDRGLEGETLFDDIKIRLKRVSKELSSKWKDIIKGFTGGFISGFISNIITTLINTVITTGKKFVRIIREGIFSLLKAFKMIAFPPKGMTHREASHEASKIFFGGIILIGGIALEEIIEKLILSVPILIPFSGIITAVIIGSITVILMALMTYLIDKFDILNVVQSERNKYINNTLDNQINNDIDECNLIIANINKFEYI